MDTKTLEKFCPWARNRLMEAVDLRCRRYGLTDDARAANPADSDVVNGTVLTAAEKSQRATLYARIEECGYTHFLEEMAYTWFNRFAAIRCMELHDYLPSRVRMLSCTADGSFRPDCLRVASELELPGLDKARVLDFMDAADDEGLFRLILLAQCNELADALPEVFAHLGAADELMLPDGLLRTGENDVLYHLVMDIPEETWQDVEVLGWMYQFYNSERKDDFFKSKRKASADDLAPATQLFTPKWIVQYLVENSLGRLWMLNNPDSHLKDQMKYFIAPDDEHEDFIRISSPEDITFCDPACGSGHILSYAFELLYAMYEERGYRPSEIPELILEKNLTGFEIDERAAQIASLVLAMRAREHDRRFLRRDVTARIHVFQSVDCEGANLPKSVTDQLEHLGEIGSLVKLTEKDLDSIHALAQEAGASLLDSKLAESLRAIEPALLAISDRYDVVVANPPYMGSSSFNPFMSSWIKKNYPDEKGDLCTCFIELISHKKTRGGSAGIAATNSWMFLSSYEVSRKKILASNDISSLVQLSVHGFKGIAAQVFAFTLIAKQGNGYRGSYIRLNDFDHHSLQAKKTLEAISNPTCGWFYRADASTFHDIPGTPIAYWASLAVHNAFRNGKPLYKYANVRQGLKTGDNDLFLRIWYEVSLSRFSVYGGAKWYPCNKGGQFRLWYGNNWQVINWENDGYELKHFVDGNGKLKSRPQNLSYMFHEGLTYTNISSSRFGIRYCPMGFAFDAAGSMIFPVGLEPETLLGLLAASITCAFNSFLSPTLSFEVGDIAKIPLLIPQDERPIAALVRRLIELSKADWDSQETSWDFTRNSLI